MDHQYPTDMPVAMRLRMYYQNLHKSERIVADYLMGESRDDVLELSIVELAAKMNVSEATVVRVCKRIGLSGYTELRLRIAQEKGGAASSTQNEMDIPIAKEDTIDELPRKIINNAMNGLRDTLTVLDVDMLKKAVRTVLRARQVVLVGVANSAIVCEDLCCKLMKLGILCQTYTDSHLQFIAGLNLTPEDVVIAVSHSGLTVETVDIARLARRQGATVICLSNHLGSPLVEASDIHLLTGGHETNFNSETMVSRLSQLAIVDMLYVGIILQNYDDYYQHLLDINAALKEKSY